MSKSNEYNFSSHSLKIKSYYKPTRCDFCSAFLIGLTKQGLQCKLCKENFHKYCCTDPNNVCQENSNKNKPNIQPEIEHSFYIRTFFYNRRNKISCVICKETINDKNYLHCRDCRITIHENCKEKVEKNCKIEKSTDSSNEDESLDEGVRQITPRRHFSKNLKLQRMSVAIKRNAEGYFWKGFMYYSTSDNTDCFTHYWRLDDKKINIFPNSGTNEKLCEVELNKIEIIVNCDTIPFRNSVKKLDRECLFYFKTNLKTYFCGMNTDPHIGMNVVAKNFFNIFKMAHLPFNRNRNSIKISAPKYEEKSIFEDYFYNPTDLLGGGQFGQVYAGQSKTTNDPVAIKIIDKTRFKENKITDLNAFQTEVAILHNLNHQGIVKLFALYDEPENLYIVTEKMATDMLEMIIKKENGRLSERIAKFCVYQILNALQYLHKRNIAHCDLKPENVLLCENTEYPQLKICDFGYAKIIDENSFRRSLVGTPAYSPPEVKQRKVFNKSMDMWSMGVIAYVSLSGVFPFDEERDIHEQIRNSNFMFPDDPWKEISQDAIDLINTEFLQVSIDRRASVLRAIQHKWFSEDEQLYYDLLDLESKVGDKWLTTKDQELKWTTSTNL